MDDMSFSYQKKGVFCDNYFKGKLLGILFDKQKIITRCPPQCSLPGTYDGSQPIGGLLRTPCPMKAVHGQNSSLRSLLAEQQALERFICVEFNSTPSLATLLSE